MSKSNWKKLSRKIGYQNPWIIIYEDKVLRPDGKEGIYGFMEKSDAIVLIPYDESTNSIFFVREYRYPVEKELIQLSMGTAEKSDKDNLERAKKELYEELSIISENIESIGKFYLAAGHETTQAQVFLATKLKLDKLSLDRNQGDEFISEVRKMTIPEVKQAIKNGKIKCGIALAALNLFFIHTGL